MLSQVPIHQEPPTHQAENGERERKRRRKALSCYDCRRRKLRCDRNFPSCSRCSKAGLASSCQYETGPNGQEDSITDEDDENPHARLQVPSSQTNGDGTTSMSRQVAGGAPSISSQTKRIAQLENRIAKMEASATSQSSSTPSNHHSLSPVSMWEGNRPASLETSDSLKREASEPETMIFRGSSFKTQYYGATNDTAQIVHFPEFFSFTKQPGADRSALQRIRADMGIFKRRRKIERAAALTKVDGDLSGLIPGREEADYLVRLYCDTFETTYRILHQPTFWKEYRQFWVDPKANPGFLAIILLTMAAVRCVSVKEPRQYVGDSTKERETAILHISACDSWLREQGLKHVTISYFQVHCLLIIAKVTNLMKMKQAWTSTGTSLRAFMSAGIHRDPSLVYGGQVSEFDQEMRRRLWSTMMELEIEASILRGMPTALAGLRTDCGCPKNINDEELDETSRELPISRPSRIHTSTSYLCISHESLSLRIALVSAINNCNKPLPYDDVLLYEEKITQQLQLIPHWKEENSGAGTNSALLEALLDIQLRQFLIILHYPFARRSGSNPQHGYSRMACFNAASSVIEQHSKLSEAGNHALSALRSDVYRTAMCLCQSMYTSSLGPNNPSNQLLSNSSIQLVERALNMLERKALLLGRGYKNFMFLSCGYIVALSKITNQPHATLRQETVDKFSALYSTVASNQTEPVQPFSGYEATLQTPPQSITTEPNGASIEGQQSTAGTPFFPVNLPFDASQGVDQQFFDFNLPGWNIDDFWAFDVNAG